MESRHTNRTLEPIDSPLFTGLELGYRSVPGKTPSGYEDHHRIQTSQTISKKSIRSGFKMLISI